MYVSLRIGLSVMELYGTEFLVSCTFQHKCYVSIFNNCMCYMYVAMVPCTYQESHCCIGSFVRNHNSPMFSTIVGHMLFVC